MIHSDREGGRQLELAVDVLASQVKQIDVRDYNDRRVAAERRLAEVRRSVAEIDRRTREHAEANLSPTEYRGERLVPMDLAARVGAERAAHAWFPDELGLDARFAPRFDDAGIDEARAARAALGPDLVYGPDAFLRVSDLPDVPGLLVAHQALVADRRSAGAAQAGDLPALSTAAATDAAALRVLHDRLIALAEWHEEVGAAAPWLPRLYRFLVAAKPAEAVARDALLALVAKWAGLPAEGRGWTGSSRACQPSFSSTEYGGAARSCRTLYECLLD